MTGGNERDGGASPLSEMSEAAPDDLFTGRSRRTGGEAGAVAPHGDGDLYGSDDDLYGGSAAVAPDPDDGENTAERPGTGR
ncbi:hypothetical protein ACWDRR_05525 [Kitasatospora sp. NPDC003701]